MQKFRFLIALAAAKLSIVALKITRHNGTNFPGVLALRICPDFIRYIGKPKRVIAVSGTNGKTTTCNMILDALTMDGKEVVNNRMGSNINSGIATSLIQNATLTGKCKLDMGVFEVDERSALRIFPYLKPDYMLITNLSRDSIMRNGHPEYIQRILTKYIPKETRLILNADDLICSNVSPENERVYFGIERMPGDKDRCDNLIQDFQICPECRHKLEFEYVRYSHIGRAFCPHCGFKAPDYGYAGCNVDLDAMTIQVREDVCGGEIATYRLLNDSVYNIYNVVSAVALFRQLGYSREQIQEFFNRMSIVGTRYDIKKVADKKIHMMLAKDKNAFAGSRVFEYISQTPGTKEIIIMNSCQDDAVHWSENICWLYDCDFEFLNHESIKNIVVCGPRVKDYRYRLLLAGVPDEKISYTDKEIDAPKQLKYLDNDNIFVLYGTDSITLGYKVAERIERSISCE
ncbi:MAG: MurT ligase domain-containing protein [Eubacteriaceae bacterium]|nr:MurT ligase domain-containing protein [Eubacteriaceae bacterium]